MDKIERKFIELYFRITQNGNELVFEEDMYPIINKTKGYYNFLKVWRDYLKSKEYKLGESFNDWFDGLHCLEDIIKDNEVIARSLPSEKIEITWGNEQILEAEIKKIYDEYIAKIRSCCKPVASNSNVSAYYNIDSSGFIVSAYSYDTSDIKLYKKKVKDIFISTRDALYAAVNRYNEAQGIGSKDNQNILLKQPSYSNSSNVKSDDSSNRGHMIDDDTVFEMSVYIDAYHLYRAGKGGTVTDDECSDFFSLLREEYVGVGPEA